MQYEPTKTQKPLTVNFNNSNILTNLYVNKKKTIPLTLYSRIFGHHGLASSLAFIQSTSGDTTVFVTPEKSVNTVR